MAAQNTKRKTETAAGLTDGHLRRAALTGKCHPCARSALRALLDGASESAIEALARSLGSKAGVVRSNLKRAVGLLQGEAAYRGRIAA